jgi:hypothetical protein
MAEQNKIFSFATDLSQKIQSMDGKIVGEDIQLSKLRLAKDEKGAMINDVVDKYFKKELTKEYLTQAKEKYGITIRDITREIAKREIEKVLGV